jgi:hypothetical protein
VKRLAIWTIIAAVGLMARSAVLHPTAAAASGAVGRTQNAAAPKAEADDPAYGLESRAAIGAHHLCSGLWVVGRVYKRTPEEILAQDIAPFREFSWDTRFTYQVDAQRRRVSVSGPGIPSRTAKYNGDQGCAILPRGESDIHFQPVVIPRTLPEAATQAWPTGDMGAASPVPAGVDRTAVAAATLV